MLKIRLQRVGRRHEPVFKVVVTEHTRGPKSADYVEKVGSYDAKNGVKQFDKERITYWIGQGAKPSDTVHNFLVDAKIVEGPKVNVLPKRKPKEEAPPEGGAPETPEANADTAAEEPATPKEEEPPKEEVKEETPVQEEKEEKKEE